MTILKVFLAIGILLSSPAWACDSYEDCMKKGTTFVTLKGVAYEVPAPTERDIQMAIAYKLDEISKKLDKPEMKIILANAKTACLEEHAKIGDSYEISKKDCLDNK